MYILLGQFPVFFGAGRLRRKGENRLFVGGTFLRRTFLLIRVLKLRFTENSANLLMCIPGNVRALIEQRNHHAEDLQIRVGTGANPAVGLEQIIRTLNRKIGRLYGHEQSG